MGEELINTKRHEYLLLEIVGEGSFGKVFKAQNTANNTYSAIKVIKKSAVTNFRDAAQLQKEVDATAILRHRNIVSLLDFFEDYQFYYIVLEYCQGGTLMDYLNKGKIKEETASIIFSQIVVALDYCHRHGVAHRDLKPENIMFTTFPNLKVSDFGLCGCIKEDKKMRTFCGSPCYAAPECLLMQEYDGKLCDVWSLGVILFEMLTGERPWCHHNVPKMIQQITNGEYRIPNFVSSQASFLIKQMMIVRPRQRIKISAILEHPWVKPPGTTKNLAAGKSFNMSMYNFQQQAHPGEQRNEIHNPLPYINKLRQASSSRTIRSSSLLPKLKV